MPKKKKKFKGTYFYKLFIMTQKVKKIQLICHTYKPTNSQELTTLHFFLISPELPVST